MIKKIQNYTALIKSQISMPDICQAKSIQAFKSSFCQKYSADTFLSERKNSSKTKNYKNLINKFLNKFKNIFNNSTQTKKSLKPNQNGLALENKLQKAVDKKSEIASNKLDVSLDTSKVQASKKCLEAEKIQDELFEENPYMDAWRNRLYEEYGGLRFNG